MMTEVLVTQRSTDWFRHRQQVQLTASKFGDAIGVGKGRPYDFLLSLLSEDTCYQESDESEHINHGIKMEPVIDEAYQLLTGNVTHASGFWLPREGNILHGLCVASPDGKIVSQSEPQKVIGLVEYKAPVYQIYDPAKHPHGIPRQYMAQIQGQMSICGAPWCDFMAVCTKTKSISLHKVHFSRTYWQFVARKLHHIGSVLKEVRQRKEKGQQYLNFPGLQRLKMEPIARTSLPGEDSIKVENLLEENSRGQYRSSSGVWLDFDFLMGTPSVTNPSPEGYEYQRVLRDIDTKIRNRNISDVASSIR